MDDKLRKKWRKMLFNGTTLKDICRMAGEKNNPFFLLIINYIQPGENESSFCANGSLNYAFATIYDCFCQLLESQYGSGFFQLGKYVHSRAEYRTFPKFTKIW